MIRQSRSTVLFGALIVVLIAGCGVIGPPVAPETIGVRAKIEREKQQKEAMQLKEQPKPEEIISSRPSGDAPIRSR